MASPHHARFSRWRHRVQHHAVTLLTLAAAAVILHHAHALNGLTAQSMRLAISVEAGMRDAVERLSDKWPRVFAFARPNESDVRAAIQARTRDAIVTMFRFDGLAFIDIFGGTLPIPRDRIADVMNVMSTQLETSKLRLVVGFDLDITDVSREPDDGPRSASSLDIAAARLSRFAEVIAIATPRVGGGLTTRNESIRSLCEHDIRFASAVADLDPGEPFYRYRAARNQAGVDRTCSLPMSSARHFPSLGYLMAVANPAEPGVAPATARPDPTLRALCELVSSSPPASSIFELGDTVAAEECLLDDYRWEYLNLAATERRHDLHTISSLRQFEAELHALKTRWAANDATRRRVLLVSVDDGMSDQHFTVGDTAGYTLGDQIQAAIAISQEVPLEVKPWLDAVADLLFGALYIGVLGLVRLGANRLRRNSLHSAHAGLVAFAPLVVCVACVVLASFVAGVMLRENHWIDPVLIIVGLTLHSYLREREHEPDSGSHRREAEAAHDRLDPWADGAQPDLAHLIEHRVVAALLTLRWSIIALGLGIMLFRTDHATDHATSGIEHASHRNTGQLVADGVVDRGDLAGRRRR